MKKISTIIREELKKSDIWKKQKLIKTLNGLNEINTKNYQWFEDETGQWVIHIDNYRSPVILYYYIPWVESFCNDYAINRFEFSQILLDWSIHNVNLNVYKLQGDMSEIL